MHQGVLAIGHVAPMVPCRTLESARRFYTDLLGFRVDWETDGVIGLKGGDASLTLFLCDDPCAFEWMSFRLEIRIGMDLLVDRADAAGFLHPHGGLHETAIGTREATLLDPSGVRITIWQTTK